MPAITEADASQPCRSLADGANGAVIRDITGSVELFDASCATTAV